MNDRIRLQLLPWIVFPHHGRQIFIIMKFVTVYLVLISASLAAHVVPNLHAAVRQITLKLSSELAVIRSYIGKRMAVR